MRRRVETVVTDSEVQTSSTKVVVHVVTFTQRICCRKKTQERTRK